ncbi:MAG: M15 family metallopeptidase [Lachnospiraceae bacterium]|nr:M15 family metallopeptidase [Lachnospiraceae bacterium]
MKKRKNTLVWLVFASLAIILVFGAVSLGIRFKQREPNGQDVVAKSKSECASYSVTVPDDAAEEIRVVAIEREEAASAKSVEPKKKQKAKSKPIKNYQAGDLVGKNISPKKLDKWFLQTAIREGDAVYNRIIGKSYRPNDNVALSDLRYLKMVHVNFDHKTQVGEMIVNASISETTMQVFKELYLAGYEIEQMRLVDDFWAGSGDASDFESIDHNNTSCFNYREVTGGTSLSNHAYGCAIDLNPQQNPYVRIADGQKHWSHTNADPYIDRTNQDPHVIKEGDICCSTFKKYGFFWGGNWTNPIDYQHFEIDQH